MRNHAGVKAVALCAALVLTSPRAQAQSTEPRAVPPEAGVPLTAGAPPAPAAPAAPLPDPVTETFAALDRDGDGKVSAVEHAEGAKAQFDALDADHNYHLSAAEVERATAGAEAGQLAAGTAATAVSANDDNDNGEISPEESRAQAEAEFLARDADRDGSLSLEEMRRMVAPAGASTPDN